MNKKRLGRGLESLLGTGEGGHEPSSIEAADLVRIPVDQIDANPFQPRRQFDPAEIAALADSLRQHGMLQPVLVRAVEGRYQLIAGERRLRASIEARLHDVPARVMELDDRQVSEIAMVENLQREDLNALEKAVAFRDYLVHYGGTQEELAGRLGLDRSTVSNLIRLLELPDEVQEAVRSKQISPGACAGPCSAWPTRNPGSPHAVGSSTNISPSGRPKPSWPPASRPPRVPAPASDPAEPGATPAGGKAPHLVDLEDHLKTRFGTNVLVRMKSRERGQIVIEFRTAEEFERLSQTMRG